MISSSNLFDILVTTPEKLTLLIRKGIETQLKRLFVLVIVDEAHNISSEERVQVTWNQQKCVFLKNKGM